MEDNGGELAQRVETRCGQRDSLLRERRETLCSLEADHNQVGSVVSSEFEGASAANGCTRSLGGREAPEALVGTRIPSVNVAVCVAKGMSETPSVEETPCATETPCVDETPCVSGVLASVPGCVLPSTPCVQGAPRVKEAAGAKKTARVCATAVWE